MIAVLIATVVAFVLYFADHPEVHRQLAHTSPWLLLGLLVLYVVFIASIGLILLATLVVCKVRIPLRESLLVTMYSAIINFFGPLQSGPAFRAVYLKKQYGLELKKYTLATLAYYGFYGGFSIVLLLSSLFKWWLIPLCALGIGSIWLLYHEQIGVARRFRNLNLTACLYLGGATLVQVLLAVVIFYLELHSLNPHIRLSQAITYTGAANLALFVSLTPGAIGFRESFLVFSRDLHHISNSVIVSANIIDRSIYVVTLMVLLVIILAAHAERRFRKVQIAD